MKKSLLAAILLTTGFSALAQPVKTQILVEPPQGVFMVSYGMSSNIYSNVEAEDPQSPWDDLTTLTWKDTTGVMTDDGVSGGLGQFNVNGTVLSKFYWPNTAWPQSENPGVTWWLWDDPSWYVTTNSSYVGPVPTSEHCDANYSRALRSPFFWNDRQTADAEMRLATGGPLGSTQKNLWCISASATAYTNVDDTIGQPVPFNQIAVGSLGNLDTNGNLWVMLPDNDPGNITPKVAKDRYTFTIGAAKYVLKHATACTAVGNTNDTRTTIGNGEFVDFWGLPGNTRWTVSGDGIIAPTNGGSTIFSANLDPGSATVTAEVNGVKLPPVDFSVKAPNMVSVKDKTDLPPDIADPLGTLMGAETWYSIVIGPVDVSFDNALLRENPEPSSKTVTWPDQVTRTVHFNRTTNGFNMVCGQLTVSDHITAIIPLTAISQIFNGTSFVDFLIDNSWTYQYLNNAGTWVDFYTLTHRIEFGGSDRKCHVIYLGVPGGWQGPFD